MTARADAVEDGATHATGSVLLDHERHRLEADLVARFCPPIPPQVVRDCVDESLALYAQAPVRTYLRILVERAAVARLRHLVLAGPDRAGASDVGSMAPVARLVEAIPAERDPAPTAVGAGAVHTPETLVHLAAAESWPDPDDDLAAAPDPVREASRCRHLRSDDRVADAATADIRPRRRETAS